MWLLTQPCKMFWFSSCSCSPMHFYTMQVEYITVVCFLLHINLCLLLFCLQRDGRKVLSQFTDKFCCPSERCRNKKEDLSQDNSQLTSGTASTENPESKETSTSEERIWTPEFFQQTLCSAVIYVCMRQIDNQNQ